MRPSIFPAWSMMRPCSSSARRWKCVSFPGIRKAHISCIGENQRDTHDLGLWLVDVFSEGTEPEQKRAMEILKKLTEYKPLAKVEEMEEQNYNMVDDVLNNGAGEKAQKEENKREQERPAARTSLKARLAEKKALVSGQGKDHDAQENAKNNQREM